jgi:hypothetical protein
MSLESGVRVGAGPEMSVRGGSVVLGADVLGAEVSVLLDRPMRLLSAKDARRTTLGGSWTGASMG